MSYPKGTAASQGLASCHTCGTLTAVEKPQRCVVCGTEISIRETGSLQKTLAFLLTATVLYIPANFLPIMTTIALGRATESTIVQGVIQLWQMGSFFIAIVIFVASVLVPILKMAALLWLCWMVKRPKPISHEQAHNIYVLTELVGKWSMVDVFVVALLVALIQLDVLMSIFPGPAALAFAGVVVFTMLSAQAFDMRLIWDREDLNE